MPGTLTPTNPKLDAISDAVIDGSGRFKYILCKIYENDNRNDFKYIVRGTARAEYHSDIYDELDAQLEKHSLVCECVGGGKITHSADEKSIEVGGKSQGYGPANHEISVGVLKKIFKDYNSITWTEG